MGPFSIVLCVFLLLVLLVCLTLLKRERSFRERDAIQWEKQRLTLQQELLPPQRQLERVMALLKDLRLQAQSAKIPAAPRALAEAIVDGASALLQVDAAVLLQPDRSLEFRASAGRGFSPGSLARLRIPPGQGALGRAAQGQTPVLTQDKLAELAEEGITAPYLIIPLPIQGRSAGLLVLCRPKGGRFAPDALELAQVLSDQAGLCLENVELNDMIERYYGDMVHSLARAVDAKDACTHSHSDRTHHLARALAQEIHLPEALIRNIEYGALLHDVGKIGIDDAILRKPDKLTPDEYTVMKCHPDLGYRILQPVQFLRPVATIVLYHQEWVNGGGYPEGLAGEEIPLGARLVAVIDAWDAMTSDRPYRKAMSKSAAITKLRRQAGTQFDSKLVDAFLRVLERFDREGIATTEQHPEAAPTVPAAS